ncbi:MAG: hypothetical protein K2L17_02240 [Muribaculaceae bacterium]|nr:hypothetical protein [Muribaculaceae bacterium]
MGLPIATIKDPSNSFPIRPLSIYVISNEENNREKYLFNNYVNRPPYSLLPIEYHFISLRSISSVNQNQIIDDLVKYSIITRDIEYEECLESNSLCLPDNYCIVYMCGQIDWKLSFGLKIALNIFTYNLLDNIKSFTTKALFFPGNNQENDEVSKIANSFRKIIKICDDSLEILAGRSKINLKPRIDDFRTWLNETTIMRASPNDFTDSVIMSSFKKRRILHSDYSIVIKKKSRVVGKEEKHTNIYQIHLKIGDKTYQIKSKEQSVVIYLFAIAFAYRGETLSRDQLTYGGDIEDEKVTLFPDQLRILTIMNYCYGALNGLNTVPLGELLDMKKIHYSRLFPEFIIFYNKLSLDSYGKLDVQKLTNLLSRINNLIIAETLKDYPEEVKRIFHLNYDPNSRYYSLNIAKENIFIE